MSQLIAAVLKDQMVSQEVIDYVINNGGSTMDVFLTLGGDTEEPTSWRTPAMQRMQMSWAASRLPS